jgi:hypothetical protein
MPGRMFDQADTEGLARAGDLSLLSYLAGLVVVMSLLAVPAYRWAQPARHANPGLAAYSPPPGTQVEPRMDRKMDAPMVLVADAHEALAMTASTPAVEKVPPVRKKRAVKRRDADPFYHYAGPRSSGYRPSTQYAQPGYASRSWW